MYKGLNKSTEENKLFTVEQYIVEIGKTDF